MGGSVSARPIEDAILQEIARVADGRLGLDDYTVTLRPAHHIALTEELFPDDPGIVVDYLETNIGTIYLAVDDDQVDAFTVAPVVCDSGT